MVWGMVRIRLTSRGKVGEEAHAVNGTAFAFGPSRSRPPSPEGRAESPSADGGGDGANAAAAPPATRSQSLGARCANGSTPRAPTRRRRPHPARASPESALPSGEGERRVRFPRRQGLLASGSPAPNGGAGVTGFSNLDYAALAFFCVAWVAYPLAGEAPAAGGRSLTRLMNGYRHAWMLRMLSRENRMV